MKFWVPALVVAAVLAADAHHPFTPHYDASSRGSITGIVVELRLSNPHVVLIVEGTAPDGRTGRWAFEGFPPHRFVRLGEQDLRERLRPGTSLTISGWPAKDSEARAFSCHTVRFADVSTMIFGPTPEEGDRWSCGAAPCSFAYPDPRAQ